MPGCEAGSWRGQHAGAREPILAVVVDGMGLLGDEAKAAEERRYHVAVMDTRRLLHGLTGQGPLGGEGSTAAGGGEREQGGCGLREGP